LVKKRIGDRRRRPRFEIVGTLTGTLETWQRFRLINLAPGGALIESQTPLVPGSRVNGRVMICGQLRDVRASVSRVEPDGQQRYQVAVEWGQALDEADSLLTTDALPQRRDAGRHIVERRRAPRVAPSIRPEIRWPAWQTVELIDISTSGVFFTSPVPLAVGERAQLRLRLGDRSFSAEVEVRRDHGQRAKRTGYPLAATFTVIDEASRFTLDDFLGDRRE
jgi:hypothetical protein